MTRKACCLALAAGALAALGWSPAAQAAGFGIFEQGSKAMGTAGAFTATADDPSAMFHNVGGLAFLEGRQFLFGTTFITQSKSEFTGAAPFPGPNARAERVDAVFFPSHFYWSQQVNDRLTFGFSFNNPFGLANEWDKVDAFPGRFISYNAELQTFDLGVNLGWKASDRFGLGIGIIGRLSDVTLEQRAPGLNPFLNQIQDVADVTLESDLDHGFGFQVGILHKYNESFSWGVSYRSKIDLDYSGEAAFTQILTGFPQFDAAVALALPVGQKVPVGTSIEFPDMASFGVALALSRNTRLEVNANWTGWSSFETLVIEFDDPRVETVERRENWQDVWNYRIGLRWLRGGSEWRFGYVLDETPQPVSSAGPLLPDNDRSGFTVGYGHQGNRLSTDLALMYLPFDDIETGDEQLDNFFGTYETTGWLLGVTLGWK